MHQNTFYYFEEIYDFLYNLLSNLEKKFSDIFRLSYTASRHEIGRIYLISNGMEWDGASGVSDGDSGGSFMAK